MVLIAPIRHTPTIVAAKPICHYCAPLWYIDPRSSALDPDDVEPLNLCPWGILTDNIEGWDPYTHVIRVTDEHGYQHDYLAQLRD